MRHGGVKGRRGGEGEAFWRRSDPQKEAVSPPSLSLSLHSSSGWRFILQPEQRTLDRRSSAVCVRSEEAPGRSAAASPARLGSGRSGSVSPLYRFLAPQKTTRFSFFVWFFTCVQIPPPLQELAARLLDSSTFIFPSLFFHPVNNPPSSAEKYKRRTAHGAPQPGAGHRGGRRSDTEHRAHICPLDAARKAEGGNPKPRCQQQLLEEEEDLTGRGFNHRGRVHGQFPYISFI